MHLSPILLLCAGCFSKSGHHDADGDGYSRDDSPADCGDTDASVYPSADERLDDHVDNDCDGDADDVDADDDGYDATADCDDTNAGASPADDEICGDGVDNNCVPDDCQDVATTYNLDDDSVARWFGAAPGDRFGASLATLHGVAGVRVAVGAPGSAGDPGAVYLLEPVRLSDTDKLTAPVLLDAGDAGDQLGGALLAADIDGDGYDDLVTGATGAGSGDGAFTVLGGASGWTDSLGGWLGEAAASGRLGASLAVIKVDDGVTLIAGAPGMSRAWLLDASSLESESSDEVAGLSIWGVPGDALGVALATLAAGPNSLLAVGAPHGALDPTETAGGLVGVLDPHRSGEIAIEDADWLLVGEPGEALGSSLVSVNLDNDGYDDLVIGAPDEEAVYVVDGDRLNEVWVGGWSDLDDSAQLAVLWSEEEDVCGLGSAVAAVPDVATDEHDGAELLLSAPCADLDEDGAADGAVWLLLSEDFKSQELTLDTGLRPSSADGAGASLAAAPRGDDEVDLLIGATGFDDGRGAVYLVPGPGQ